MGFNSGFKGFKLSKCAFFIVDQLQKYDTYF